MRSWFCVAFLGLLPFALFWEGATFQRIPVVGDIFEYNYPLQHFIAEQVRAGRLPLWNNLIFSGIPLLAQGQTGPLYPLNVLLAFVPTWVAMSYSLLLHCSLSGVFTFLYARGLGLGRSGAVVAGIVFEMCGFSMSHLGHLTIVRTIPWLPLILWSVERWRRRFDLKAVGVGALAVGLMLLAGHPQVPVYALGLTVLYVLYLVLPADKASSRWRIALGGAVMVGVGMLLAAAQLWGMYVAARFFARPPQFGEGYAFFTSYSLYPPFLLHMIFPRLFVRDMAVAEMTGYVGILPVALAALAVVGWKHRIRWFFLLTACFSILLVLGGYTPLYQIMYRLPIYNAFRVPPRNWFEFDFALAILAGAGLDRLTAARVAGARCLSRWARALSMALLLLGGWIVVAGLWVFAARVQHILARNGVSTFATSAVWLPLVMILLGAAVLFLVSLRPRPGVSAALVIGVITADLFFSFAQFSFTTLSTDRFLADVFGRLPGTVEFLEQDGSLYRQLTYSPTPRLDYEEWGDILAPNVNMLYGVDSAEGYDSVAPTQYIAFADGTLSGTGVSFHVQPRLLRELAAVLDLLNVKYIVVPVRNNAVSFGNIAVVEGVGLDIYPYPALGLCPSSGLLTATLDLPSRPVTTLALASYLSDGAALPDGQPALRVMVTDVDGQVSTFDLNVGQHTAEGGYDCDPEGMNHRRPTVAYDLLSQEPCPHHVYFARLELGDEPVLPRRVVMESLLETGCVYVHKMTAHDSQTGANYPVSVAQGYLAYLSGDRYRLVYENELARVYQNTRVLPRAFLVPRVVQVENADEANQIVHRGVFGDGEPFVPTQVALVEAPVGLTWSGDAMDSGRVVSLAPLTATIVSARPGRMEVRAGADEDAFLVYSENYFPGWHASVDGEPAAVYRTDGTLLGVPIPAGEHSVTLTFRPTSLVVAFGGSVAGLVLILGLLSASPRLLAGRRRS